MKNKSLKWLFLCCLALFSQNLSAQTVLDTYVQQALDSNVVIKQRSIQLEKALLSLQTAKSNYLPSVNFSATYSTAQGGRYAELPLGQLLNPVYTTLNQMTSSSNFPQVEDQQINFLPNNYYDAYVRTSMPLLNLDIQSNTKIQQQKVVLSELEQSIYARELVKNVKVAYFSCLMAQKSVEIYRANQSVLDENVRMNEALIKEGKGLQVNLLKAQSERMKSQANLSVAENQLKNAQTYFNFLLNRDFNTEIVLEELVVAPITLNANASNREEAKVLNQAIGIQETVLQMNERYWVPKVNAFLDLGSQGTDFEISNKSAYYMVGVSASIPIYNGSRNKQQIKQTELSVTHAKLELENISQQLELATQQAVRNCLNAKENWEASKLQLQTSQAYFDLVSGAKREGLTSQLEFIDATNQVTNAQIYVSVQYQNYLITLAELERATASYPIHLSTQTTK